MAEAGGDHDRVPAPAPVSVLTLDRLTPAVVDVRRGLAQVEAGAPIADADDRDLRLRRSRCAGMGSRLVLVTDPSYARHPLLADAVRMRERLAVIERAIAIELATRTETDFRWRRARALGQHQG